MKQSLKVKLEMAKFLQETLDNMSLKGSGHSSQAAKDFVEFFEKVRNFFANEKFNGRNIFNARNQSHTFEIMSFLNADENH